MKYYVTAIAYIIVCLVTFLVILFFIPVYVVTAKDGERFIDWIERNLLIKISGIN